MNENERRILKAISEIGSIVANNAIGLERLDGLNEKQTQAAVNLLWCIEQWLNIVGFKMPAGVRPNLGTSKSNYILGDGKTLILAEVIKLQNSLEDT